MAVLQFSDSLKNSFLVVLTCLCITAGAQAPQTSPEKYAEFIPLYPKGKVHNSKGLNLKDSIANERIYRVGTPGMYTFFPSSQENKGDAFNDKAVSPMNSFMFYKLYLTIR